jgi:predicted DNA-binding transcriptional regulator YafY
MPIPSRGKSNLNQLERVREIHRQIQRFTANQQNHNLRVTCDSLAQKLDVSDRQIRRDIQTLAQRIEEKDVEGGYGAEDCALYFDKKRLSYLYRREVDLSVWVGRLDDEELGALLVAQQSLAVFSGMPLAKHIDHIFEEDAGGLVGNSRSILREEIIDLISFHPEGAGEIDAGDFTTIYRGLLLQQQIEVSYQSKTSAQPKKRILNPYHLCCFKNQWRLLAYDSHHKAVRDFVVTKRRLHSVRLLTKTFKRSPGFSRQEVHDHISGSQLDKMQEITLRVAKAGAHYIVEREWVGLQSKTELDDGSVLAVFRVRDTNDFMRFVLGFGRDCVVLGPEKFRKEIEAEAQGIISNLKGHAMSG